VARAVFVPKALLPTSTANTTHPAIGIRDRIFMGS
jgi:hypothetical protein